MYRIAQPAGILVRMLAVMLIVGAIYNPGGYSWYHWVAETGWNHWIAKIFMGLSLLAGLIVCVHATIRSLGLLLGLPIAGLIAALIWLAVDRGIIDWSDWLQRTLALEGGLILLLSTGVSFSLIRYRLSGQLDSRTIA